MPVRAPPARHLGAAWAVVCSAIDQSPPFPAPTAHALPRLVRLTLRDFRNYAALDWRPDPAPAGRLVVVTGPNGSGKTNLLEALSLLVPGRGLRGARGPTWPRRVDGMAAPGWGVAAQFATAAGPLALGTGVQPDSAGPRRFLLDGAAPRSQAQIAARLAMVWLTPQMDQLFAESASGRRRFLDRLVYALQPDHARQIAAHDMAQSQRARLLATGGGDAGWLAGIEDSIARHAVAATAARSDLVARLNAALATGAAAGFPPARMTLLCPIADRLARDPALAAEDWLRRSLADARRADTAAGSARWGAQRADMALADAQTGLAAELASTGQQKTLLIGVILGHADLIARLRGEPPVLLLDEPLVHLDATLRAHLCTAVRRLPGQIILTGTDATPFTPLADTASFVRTDGESLV